MKISTDEIKRLAKLARLDVTDQESKTYADQLTDILNYAEQVQNFSLEKEMTEQEKAIQIINSDQMRLDEVEQQTDEVIEILLNAVPQKHGKFVKSPKAL